MNGIKEEVLTFLDKCEQLKMSKFIMATAEIKDLLTCIAGSSALYNMFQSVTGNFDYVAAKRSCFVTTSNGYFQRSYLKLPEDPVSCIAFIFCLLVEFDHETLNFTNFILQYFPEDGSCYASFHSFCDKVIVTLEELIKEVFKDELSDKSTPQDAQPNIVNEKLAAITSLIAQEANVILQLDMPENEKQDGIRLLDEIHCAINEGRRNSLEAILCGYDYYCRYHNNFSQFIDILTMELN